LAINRYFKGADLFLTITANPNWPEIQLALLPGQTSSDRPDLVSRVFRLKAAAILKDLESGVFGTSVAHVWTTEFQKRGLPHMHMIIFLHENSKLRTVEDIDSLLCAELPNKNTHPELYTLVLKHLVHGPCGALNPFAPCMVNGKCSKNFPKPFRDHMTISEDSYACLRRRNDGMTHRVGTKDIDNCWVVPYSPWLIWRYQCHINLECVSSVKAIKYIYKYIYKGHDRITMEFGRSKDEIKLYLDACYVSACEALWHIYQFLMHEEFPPVVRLEVHLEGQHLVTWREDNTIPIQQVLQQSGN
jgi:hypothetical protein